jgi:ABC-type bacteriocin/lantibiotic exporter with double-glycine peptidase domain
VADNGAQAVSVGIGRRRRFFAPEVIQTSAMDCGPAALKSLMGGFFIDASYGRLREACHTDVDGTSVDTIEDLAVRLGLKAEQVMVPVDHVILKEAELLPCMVVVKLEGSGTHFVVAWRKIGRFLQVMDPASGRHWVPAKRFLEDVYQHSQRVPADAWREWAAGDGFAKPLLARMRRAGVSSKRAKELLEAAQRDPGWKPLAALDAAVHLAQSLHEPTLVELASQPELIPADYWRITVPEDGAEDEVIFKGAVAMRCEGRQPGAAANTESLPESLRAVLTDKPPSAARELWTTIRAGGLGIPLAALLAGVIASVSVLLEALLLRSLFSLSPHLPRAGERIATAIAFVLFLASLAAIEWAMEDLLRGAGRGLEVRLRAKFSFKIPRLGDRYFQSRLISDMAQRAHAVQMLRNVPPLAMAFLRMLGSITATVAGIIWLYPHTKLQAVLCGATAILVPLLGQPWLVERDLRFREYAGSLTRFYLDALLGIVPVRTHGAGPALRYHQSTQLMHWARAGLRMQKTAVLLETLQMLASYAAAAWLVYSAMDRNGGNAAALILLVFWALSLPEMGRALSSVAWQWPALRNSLLRLLEPLGAPEEALLHTELQERASTERAHPGGVRIEMQDVTVAIAGHPILEEINLTVAPGEHVGIVGLSGAGKSSLVGLLLGWYRNTAGQVLVDGEPLTAARLLELRGQTAWVDPQVQLWNDSLLSNLRYGLTPDQPLDAARAVRQANLAGVIQSLPDGMQTSLGEGGALLSGGEGQRVRMARAYGKPGVRLAILDEPARGLDRGMREEFVARARESWKDATLLCITHDVASTKAFSRVLVIENGRIIEDGSPSDLCASQESRYRQLCDREDEVRNRLWNAVSWRRLRMTEGRLSEDLS